MRIQLGEEWRFKYRIWETRSTVPTLIDWALETLKAGEFVVKKTRKIELERQGHE